MFVTFQKSQMSSRIEIVMRILNFNSQEVTFIFILGSDRVLKSLMLILIKGATNLVSELFLEGEQIVLAVSCEHLDCDGLQEVAPLVDLLHLLA